MGSLLGAAPATSVLRLAAVPNGGACSGAPGPCFRAQGEEGAAWNCKKQTETEGRFGRLCGRLWHVLSAMGWLAVLLERSVICPTGDFRGLLQFGGLVVLFSEC